MRAIHVSVHQFSINYLPCSSDLFSSIRFLINYISTWNMYLVGPFISFYKNMVRLEKQQSVVTLNKFYRGLHIYMLKTLCIGKHFFGCIVFVISPFQQSWPVYIEYLTAAALLQRY